MIEPAFGTDPIGHREDRRPKTQPRQYRRYRLQHIRVPVVDRGPYVAGRDFDLTYATKEALGFGDTGEVWSTR